MAHVGDPIQERVGIGRCEQRVEVAADIDRERVDAHECECHLRASHRDLARLIAFRFDPRGNA